MKTADNQTYDFICFTDLAYEFDICDKKEAETKIKRRLKYYKLGDYNQERVDYIRNLKNHLYKEISKFSKSEYYIKSNSNFADFKDFNFEKMVIDFNKEYDEISKSEIGGMINFAIYLYYMR
jgi:hypothetical protein